MEMLCMSDLELIDAVAHVTGEDSHEIRRRGGTSCGVVPEAPHEHGDWLVVGAGSDVRCIYDEALDLRELGKLQITRASHVKPDAEGYWWADMGPVGGPVLGPYGSRSEALVAERGWLAIRLSERQAGSPVALDEPENHHQQDRTERGNENGPQQTLAEGNTKSLHNPTAK
jgi:hypothetical protein